MMSEDSDRLPRGEIPDPLICPFEGCREAIFKHEGAFKGHMHGKHRIKYELAPQAPNVWYKNRELIPKTKERTTLLPWHNFMLLKRFMYNTSAEDLSKEFNVTVSTINDLFKSPAAKALVAKLESQLEPKMLVQNLMETDIFGKYLDWQQAWVWAMENRDYDAIHKMSKDIALKSLTGDDKIKLPTQITINLGGSDLESKPVLTSYEVVEDEDGDEDYE